MTTKDCFGNEKPTLEPAYWCEIPERELARLDKTEDLVMWRAETLGNGIRFVRYDVVRLLLAHLRGLGRHAQDVARQRYPFRLAYPARSAGAPAPPQAQLRGAFEAPLQGSAEPTRAGAQSTSRGARSTMYTVAKFVYQSRRVISGRGNILIGSIADDGAGAFSLNAGAFLRVGEYDLSIVGIETMGPLRPGSHVGILVQKDELDQVKADLSVSAKYPIVATPKCAVCDTRTVPRYLDEDDDRTGTDREYRCPRCNWSVLPHVTKETTEK